MTPIRVFISYSHLDQDLVQSLLQALTGAGVSVWVDKRDIGPGDFLQHIDQALRNCSWFVMALTPNALRSPAVRTEMDAAINQVWEREMNGVIPVLLLPCDAKDIPAVWKAYHRYDATTDFAGTLDEVIRVLKTDDALSPERAQAAPRSELLVMLVSLYHGFVERRCFKDALAVAERMINVADYDADAWNRKAYAHNELGQPDKGRDASDKALFRDPGLADAWNNNAWALNMLHSYEQALAAIERGLQITDRYAFMWDTKGVALHGLGRDEEAIPVFERATELAPWWPWGWFDMGKSLHALGRDQDALRAFETALRAAPDNTIISSTLEEARAWPGAEPTD